MLVVAGGCIPDPDPAAVPADNTRALLATLDVTSNATTSSLAPALSPSFDPQVTSYTVVVPNSAAAVTVKAKPADPSRAILKIQNQTVQPDAPFLVDGLVPGTTKAVSILVEETGAGGFPRTYTLQVTRAQSPLADLASLRVSEGNMTPPFDPQQLGYTVKTGSSVTSATIEATALEQAARVTINGQAVGAGKAFGPATLAVGPNPFTIVVTPLSGTPKQYSVVIIRGASGVADLATLSVSAGTLSPKFNSDTLAYTVATQHATSSTTVAAIVAETTAKLKINGQDVPNGQASPAIDLKVGDTEIPIVVTAPDGTVKTYKVTVRRPQSSNNDLSSLSVSAGTLSPGFASGTTGYSLAVPSVVAATTVTAAVADPTASITVKGAPLASGQTTAPIQLALGPNAIPVEVTAQNGAKKTYTVTITRNANADLSNLSVSAGGLTPSFTAGVTSYSLSVPNATATTTVTATLADPTSTMTINGQAVASGQAFGPVPLVVNQDNTFTIVVTSAGGLATKSYVVVVKRPASANAELANLQLSPGLVAPAPFSPAVTAYTVSNVGIFTSFVTIVATVADPTATLTIAGQAAVSGQAFQAPLAFFGPTSIPIDVRAQDTVTLKTYTVTVTH